MRMIDADWRRFVFIDLGCGKGKILLMAAPLPFKQIIGVEMSATLIQAAERNLRRIDAADRARRFRLECIDAGEYAFPTEPSVCYLYDPFHEDVMRRVLENMRRSLTQQPRELYVVYLAPTYRELLDDSGFLQPVRVSSWYSIHKASGV
jgi:tRNA1(Val) A37 N6-methylase TrmN6